MVKTDLTFIKTQTNLSNVYSKGNSNSFTMIVDEQFWFYSVCRPFVYCMRSCIWHEYLTLPNLMVICLHLEKCSLKIFLVDLFTRPSGNNYLDFYGSFHWISFHMAGQDHFLQDCCQFWLYESLSCWISLSPCWEFSKLEENWAEMDFSC